MKKEEIANKRFLILGAARSGIAAVRLLQRQGGHVCLADSKSEDNLNEDIAAEVKYLGVPCYWGDEIIISELPQFDFLVKSPGIPQTAPLIIKARELDLRIISEIELASAFINDEARVIAITGTNGKTTTTAWIVDMLNKGGYDAVVGGNIGDAWSNNTDRDFPNPAKAIFAIETSSFQLEDIEDFCPDVALLTNLSPDHMDRYDDSMEKYVGAKFQLLKNMTSQGTFVYNAGDSDSIAFAQRFNGKKAAFASNASLIPKDISLSATVINSNIIVSRNGTDTVLLKADELPIPGKHNLENALSAILACVSAGVDPSDLVEGLKSFPGVEHRIEFCGEREDGVRFYNDSKATNLDAMKQAVVAFDQPIVLVVGGRDAHSDYASINHLITAKIKHMITLGEAAELIENAWGNLVPWTHATSMEDAVNKASGVAQSGNVVVFSPACKSFDMYNNFEERGRDFKEKVSQLLNT